MTYTYRTTLKRDFHYPDGCKLWDLNRDDGKNIIRFVWRRPPKPFVHVIVGSKCRMLRLGNP